MAHSVSEVFGKFGESLREEQRHCEKHGDYTAHMFGMGTSRPAAWTVCEKCMEEKRQEEDRIRREQEVATYQREAMERKIGRACIPPRFADRSFDNYTAETREQKRALFVCKEYADNFGEHRKAGRGILLLGNVGTGKTHLAAAIANHVVRYTKSTALYITAAQIIRHVKGSFDREAQYSETDAYQAFGEPSLLIIDEIGVQNATEFELTVMFEVINLRYEEMRPTIVISNRSIADLPKYLGDRVIDRLRENGGKLVVFDWASARKTRSESE
ncbi:Chromosomal replication initiator protein DnaA [compost metagenome]